MSWLRRSYGRLLRDEMSLPVVKMAYLDRVSSLESKNVRVAKELWSVARDEMSLPVAKMSWGEIE